MTLSLLLLACAPRPALPPAPMEAAAVAPVRLSLDPSMLAYDDRAGTATYTPGSAVMSDAYDVYVLDLASLEAALGARPTAPVDVLVLLGTPVVEQRVPDDPNLPAPAGGFRVTTRTGRVVGVAE